MTERDLMTLGEIGLCYCCLTPFGPPRQEVRNHVARMMLRCTVNELFEWRFMQTDPNWGNFLFDRATGKRAFLLWYSFPWYGFSWNGIFLDRKYKIYFG